MQKTEKSFLPGSPRKKATNIHLDALRSPILRKQAHGLPRQKDYRNRRKEHTGATAAGVRATFAMDEIFGQAPEVVVNLFRKQGIDPTRPYRARFTFSDVTIEQD